MSKCPFWSTGGECVSCYSECPMHQLKFKDEECVFKEYSTDDSEYELKYKDIIPDAYSDSNLLNFGYLNISSL